jgi:hypothetical protein
VRRSTASMLILLGALSTPLAAQTEPAAAPPPEAPPQPRASAIGVGFAATLGNSWQIESGEIGYVRRARGGLVRALSLGARIGSYVDEGAILGGNRGFVFAPTLAVRSGRLMIAELGDENNLTQIGVDFTVEATGYLTSNPPPLQRASWGAVALLPGFRVGGNDGPQYGFVIGPTWFLGSTNQVRTLLAFRVEAPLARRERHP